MSQPRPLYNQLYASYQPDFPSYTAQFPVNFPPFNPPAPPARTSSEDAAPQGPAVPDASFVTPRVASLSMQRFLSSELSKTGFNKSEPAALHRLELEVLAFVQQLFGRAKEYAELSSRPRTAAMDLVSACEEYGMAVTALRLESKRTGRKRKRSPARPSVLEPPSPRPASPELLPSDDEGAPLVIPQTLRSLPSHLPTLPPKHTYLRTPAPPPKKQALPSLEKKLENASLVQDSLRNLLLSTEDREGQEDGELLGGVVNWDITRQPRKKWKIRG